MNQDPDDDAPTLRAALAGLIGLRLVEAFRWHQIDIFNFGPPVSSTMPDGTEVLLARVGIHLQCAWGLVHGGEPLVGRYNALVLEADEDGESLHNEDDCARLLRVFMDGDPERRRRVTGIRLARGSDLAIALDDGSVLEARAMRWVDPAGDKLHSEYWRLLDTAPDGQTTHYIVQQGPTDEPPWTLGVGPWSERPSVSWVGPKPAPEAAMEAVAALAGEPLRGSYRRDGRETFRFGPVVEFSKPNGGTGLSPRYLLRLRCEWALVRAGRVVTGYEDCMYPADDDRRSEGENPSGTKKMAQTGLGWRKAPTGDEPRLRDVLLNAFFAEAGGSATPRMLTSARLSGGWDLDFDLDDGTTIEVRPRHHLADGWWYWQLLDVQEGCSLVADGDGVSFDQVDSGSP